MNCKKCNNEMLIGSKLCIKCGEKVTEEVFPAITEDIKNNNIKKKSPLVIIISIIIAILAFGVTRYFTQKIFPISDNISQVSQTQINETVKKIKESMILPYQIDDVTSLVDITAELNAVRYHNVLSSAVSGQITNDSLREYLLSVVCNNKDTKNILLHGANIEYAYVIKDTQQNYFVLITRSDCSL